MKEKQINRPGEILSQKADPGLQRALRKNREFRKGQVCVFFLKAGKVDCFSVSELLGLDQ